MSTGGAPTFGPPFDIPAFTISGALPPYLGITASESALMSPYETSLAKIASKLCNSTERKTILRGLLTYRQQLARIGLISGFQWLSGSFMEDIETLEKRPPNDVDVVTFCHRPAHAADDTAWQLFNTVNLSLLHPASVKTAFRCDSYFVDLNLPPSTVVERARYWFGLYSHRRSGLWKGLLQVPLNVTQDDVDASKLVGP
jgi:hypothetical protein